jgi:hypothetical protein
MKPREPRGSIPGGRRASVLFIGNSFTARHDLPGRVAALAAARGVLVEHRLLWAGGASLRRHWNKGEAATAIAGGRWDWVVLQEQSTLSLKNAGRFGENVRLFVGPVRDAGAKLALYMTWARRSAGDAAHARLAAAYEAVGAEVGATVVPVGRRWHQRMLTGDATLYDRDGSHPSPAGTDLAASVFVETLIGKPHT